MAGKQRTREQFAAMDEVGLDEILVKYVEFRSAFKVAEWLTEICPIGISRGQLYFWLKQSDERWEKWTIAKSLKGEAMVDESIEIAMETTNATSHADALKVRTLHWIAERFNRDMNPQAQAVSDAKDLASQWLEALKIVTENRVSLENPEILEAEIVPENPVQLENPVSPENPDSEENDEAD